MVDDPRYSFAIPPGSVLYSFAIPPGSVLYSFAIPPGSVFIIHVYFVTQLCSVHNRLVKLQTVNIFKCIIGGRYHKYCFCHNKTHLLS